MKKKLIAVVAVIVALCGVMAGTVAFLSAKTQKTTNLFVLGKMNITFEEPDATPDPDAGEGENVNKYVFVPGSDITKKTKLTVAKGSEACWLFVKIDESADFTGNFTYDVASGWIQLQDAEGNNVTGVYYREQAAIASDGDDAEYKVIADDKVTALDSIDVDSFKSATLDITCGAIQHEGYDTPIKAWSALKSLLVD